MKKSITLLFVLCSLFLVVRYVDRVREQAVLVAGEAKDIPIVVIDAGHGGKDPGKVGVNEVFE